MIEIGIVKVELLNDDNIDKREVKVTMKSGSEIHIVACHDSWEQYGGFLEEEQATVPIAEKYNDWLHGID